MSKEEIAVSFSNGEFDKIIEHLSDEADWEIVGDIKFIGKPAIVENCTQVSAYFRSVNTTFTTLNVIVQDNKVVVNGTGKFTRDSQVLSFVAACDLYEFDNNGKILNITSYCIPTEET
ncbi:hypothetical protein GCM10009119_00320 [Algoriphagus jejuensis]|uniref:SnoaL-like domain-containing protein n=1 Tax=Algoriphagus jejuensis TaxID=419934 RepID=A0ABN1MVE1_9BACT